MKSHATDRRRVVSSRRRRRHLLERLEDRRLLFGDLLHAEITGSALSLLQPSVVDEINAAHQAMAETEVISRTDHFHGSDFSGSVAVINERLRAAVAAADPAALDVGVVANTFGRIVHAAQDFYAHSNWTDLLSAGLVDAGSLIETGLSYWNNFTPYTLQQVHEVNHDGRVSHGVMTAEAVGINEDETPRSPFGVVHSIGKSVEDGGADGDLHLAWVEAGGKTFSALVTGTFWNQPDHTPDAADFAHSDLNKNSESHPLHASARALAEAQTEHELVRLFRLVEERWGDAQHLRAAWLGEGNESAFETLLDSVTASARSLDALAAEIQDGKIRHATIVTHGFQPSNTGGDSLIDLAQALHHRSGGWLIDYDIPEEGQRGYFQLQRLPSQLDDGDGIANGGHVVLMFDWAAESNELSDGWTESAGDALMAMLVDLGLVQPVLGAENPVGLHFIAHSFGSAVASEAIERLSRHDVQVDQVTYLDPHDFDQDDMPVDGEQRQATVGMPQPAAPGDDDYLRNYGASVWQNVAFADVYFETRGTNDGSGVPDFIVPRGRPIPGAFNRWMNDGEELPDLSSSPLPFAGPYPVGYASGDHSHLWDYWYIGTIIGAEPTDDLARPAELPAGAAAQAEYFAASGYAYSAIARGQADSPVARPAANFYDLPTEAAAGEDLPHAFSSPRLVNAATGAATRGADGRTGAHRPLGSHRSFG